MSSAEDGSYHRAEIQMGTRRHGAEAVEADAYDTQMPIVGNLDPTGKYELGSHLDAGKRSGCARLGWP